MGYVGRTSINKRSHGGPKHQKRLKYEPEPEYRGGSGCLIYIAVVIISILELCL